MSIEIINQPKTLTLYGFSKVHEEHRSRGEEFLELLNQVWAEVSAKSLKSTGINHAVYFSDVVFAALELKMPDVPDTILEKKVLTIQRYAYWKHIGPYSKLPDAWNKILSGIKELGLTPCWPQMEIYGHWNEDESKLETEILINLN